MESDALSANSPSLSILLLNEVLMLVLSAKRLALTDVLILVLSFGDQFVGICIVFINIAFYMVTGMRLDNVIAVFITLLVVRGECFVFSGIACFFDDFCMKLHPVVSCFGAYDCDSRGSPLCGCLDPNRII